MSAVLVCAFSKSFVFFTLFIQSSLLLICLFVFKASSDLRKRRMKIRPIKTDKIQFFLNKRHLYFFNTFMNFCNYLVKF